MIGRVAFNCKCGKPPRDWLDKKVAESKKRKLERKYPARQFKIVSCRAVDVNIWHVLRDSPAGK